MMEYIDIKKGYTKDILEKVSRIIKAGGIVILPTDTVYGIVSDSFNEEAVKKIYDLKLRDSGNPVSIVVANKEMIKSVTDEITEIEEKIIEKFFPGALTIILKKNNKMSDLITSGKDTVGIRMPKVEFLLELVSKVRKTNCSNKLQPCWKTSNNRCKSSLKRL